jgi:isoquinoline 1-oxidoreductase beta subunit
MMELQMTRRTFLKTTVIGLTGMTLGCTIEPWPSKVKSSNVTVWINISEDNQITIMVTKGEMGQGLATALPMIVAEELEADWEKVKVELIAGVGDYTIGWMEMTAGSESIKILFEPLREVGAAAKEMLITACAQRWQVDPGSLTAENSYVTHPTQGSLSYGELAEEASILPVPEEPQLKDPSEFKIIGQPLARLDTPDHIAGKSIFGTDVVVPDMLYAAVRQSPVFGGEVSNFDSLTVEGTSAEAIVEIPGGVAVVAKSCWEAERVARSLELEFDNPEEMQDLNSEDISQRLTQDLNKPGTQINLIGDPVSAMETAPIKVDATYEVPFLTHSPMEPMTCTAKVTPESCEVWVPTQGVQFLQSALGTLTGLDSSSIEVHPTYLGGAFGRKIETDYVVHAVLAAKAVGKPVKVIWSREEDIQHGFYRPAFKAELKGGIDDTNSITSWIGKNVGPSMVSGFGLNYDPSAITGFSDIPYEAPNFSAHYVESNFGIPVGWWRSVGHSQNSFFVESFTDELAHAAGEDPLVFRRAHLKDNARILTVLERVAEMANWGQASVPGATHGVALVLYSNALLAQIAEVSVESGGEVKVHKVYCAIDCGDVVNPDIVKAQIEGSVIFGLTATLYGEITIEKGRVKQSNFHDHPLLTIKDSPVVETEIIISGATLGGVGETGLPTIAPAVTNAIYAATGHRIRKLPVSRYEFS